MGIAFGFTTFELGSRPRALCICIVGLAIFVAARAQAQQDGALVEVRVQPGDTCRTVAARVFGDPRAIELIHRHNPELGPAPHRLVPGTVLRVPRPSEPAELSAVYRRVERRAPEASLFEAARAGQDLPRGTHVRTHERSSAEITFEDQARVTVREQTLVIVYGGRRRLVERPITRAELERGALRSRLGELAGRRPLEVRTPSSQASFEGDAVVRVEDDGTSRVSNHARTPATVIAAGARVRLPAGTGTVVRRGQRPQAPRVLLPAPRWRADIEGPVYGVAPRGATLSGGFEPVAGALRTRVEVARRPDGGDLVATLEVEGGASRFEAHFLPEGSLYVSLASIDEAGLEGRRSPWRAFTVRLIRLLAPGGMAIEPSHDPARVLPGTWVVAPRGMRCRIGGEAPSERITLRNAGRFSVACEDAGGRVRERFAIDVVAPQADTEDVLVRDRTSRLEIALRGGPAPPPEALRLRVPDGFTATRVSSSESGALTVDVSAPQNAASPASLTLEVLAEDEHVALSTFTVDVRDSGLTASSAGRARPTTRQLVVQSAMGDLGWLSALSLRDERRVGFGGLFYVAPIATAVGDPQLRLGVGARAQIPDLPIRIAFATQIDVLARPREPERRGEADLSVGLGALVLEEELFALAVDLSAWIPTRAPPESFGRVRLAPNIEASLRPIEWLVLRTRQGALIDAAQDGAGLWAFAVGGDITLLDWLGFGLELDGSIGRFADRDGAAIALGGGIELRLSLFELALGARFALTDEARVLWGDWSGIASVRVFSR